jgi:hypothetical protein
MLHRRTAVFATAATVLVGIAPLASYAHADGSTLPADYPAAGCFTYSDPKGDAVLQEGPAAAPNDPDLDILGAALETTDSSLKAYVKVDGLTAAGPAMADGHRFTVKFTFNKHTFAAAGSDYSSGSGDAGSGALRDGLAQTGHAGQVDQLSVDGPALTDPTVLTSPGFVDSGLKVTFDYANSWVVFDLPLADIAKYGGAPLGGTLDAVSVISATDEYAVSSQWDSTVKDNGTTSTDTWTAGDNKCFGPPAAQLTNTGMTKVQYTDAATVAAKLTDASGAALAGQPVTFALGKLQTTATTNSSGVATAKLTPAVVAGSYSLVTSFPGTDKVGAASISTPFTVVAEKTVATLAAKTSGDKRLVTATLRDDDKHAVAGQKITWTVGGRSAGTATTSKAGTAVLAVKPGQTVKVTFAGVKSKYAASSASRKA